MEKRVASISLSGEMTLNLHSLNNEGGEGNQIMSRQVTVTDVDRNEYIVNAISGDMFKHIAAVYLVNYCMEHGLALSDYSKRLDPNRVSSQELLNYIEANNMNNVSTADVIDALIKICTVCDIHGILITDKIGDNKNSTNTPRKSILEFGWTVGIPHVNSMETFLHTKLVSDAGGKGKGTSGNEGQNIFHRPANNGTYAFVCNMDVYRIGYNDVARKFSINEEEREKRYKALLMSLLSSFVNPRGAMVSTQKPHITGIKGVVAISYRLIPAPTVSAINPQYRENIEGIKKCINQIEENAIETIEFNDMGELAKIFVELSGMKPYKTQEI